MSNEEVNRRTSTMLIYACLAGVTIGGTLLSMMGLSFLASATLLLVTSPLLLVFSPLIFGAVIVLVIVVAGFVVSVLMAFAGVYTLALLLSANRTGNLGELSEKDGWSFEVSSVM